MSLKVDVRRAVHGLVRCLVDGTDRPVYLHPDGRWVCLWDSGREAIWVRARDCVDGLAVEVRIDRRLPPLAAALAA